MFNYVQFIIIINIIESQYYKYLAKAQGILIDFDKDNKSISCKGTRASNYKFVKLPTIQLPKFCGAYETWLEFRDTFTCLVYYHDEIDEINKFHYLRASMEGSAVVVIQSILTIQWFGSYYAIGLSINVY